MRRLFALRRRREEDLERELRSHVELEAAEQCDAGLPEQEAYHAARRAFGNAALVKEDVRESWGWTFLDRLFQDLLYALRTIRKSPGFVAVAILTLAWSIGANSAIFSVVNAVLLRSLPYPESERLVQVWENDPHSTRISRGVSYPDLLDWRAQNQAFEDIAGVRVWAMNITGGDYPETLPGAFVTANLFSLLRATPMLGRAFMPGEDEPGRNGVVMLSYGLWQRRFGGDPAVVGQGVMIDGRKHTVVGIMPADFDFPANLGLMSPRDLWVPFGAHPERLNRARHNFTVIARLKTGITIERAQANLDAIVRGIADSEPGHRGRGAIVAGLLQIATRETGPALLMLMVAVGLVLLIACANLANLQLARAAAQQREAAIRQALGAGRRRLIRQLLTENILIALLGGAAGLLLARWGTEFLVKFGPNLPRLHEARIDSTVAGITLLISLVTGILFGLVPAFHSSRIDLARALNEAGVRSTAGTGRTRTRSALVMTEMALAVVVLIGAGLLIRSFLALQKLELGFHPEKILTAQMAFLGAGGRGDSRQVALQRAVLDRLETLPGVEAAGAASAQPFRPYNHGPFRIEGRPAPRPGEPVIIAQFASITPGYLGAMGIPLRRGRIFSWSDNEEAPLAAAVNETLARQFWPGQNPIGKRLSIDEHQGVAVWRQIVGVIGDTKQVLAEPVRPEIYLPLAQAPQPLLILSVKARSDPASLADAVRREVMAVNKDQPLFGVGTMKEVISSSLKQQRFQTLLLGVFGLCALLLAAVGIFGLVSYSVSQRTHEIGIRMALGAQNGEVLGLVMRQGLRLALAGVAIGLPASLLWSRMLSRLLYGVSATDPVTFVVVALVLFAVSSLASYLPARRATRVDPITALRYE